MAEQALKGHPDIFLTIRRSAQARRITLRISQLDGRVSLTLPKDITEVVAIEFAQQKAPWIRKHLECRLQNVFVGIGKEIPISGRMRLISKGLGRSVQLKDKCFYVPGHEATVPRKVLGYLKVLARDRLAAASDYYASKLGYSYSGISIRDTRSRWGSCSSAGRLMYSWRLVMAPPDVLNYVAAHEVAHLAHMDHSPKFWKEVKTIFGPYKDQRQWLRIEGTALHRYRFDD
ncbi:MAG: M48 family metallopeptidase [Tateyamaria sp.]|jgi:predicted metal-dependent hydrolase|nr:M48 family metallopeptidase [Tateyamaria sp.]